jgi:hypothetical protein
MGGRWKVPKKVWVIKINFIIQTFLNEAVPA